MQQDVIPASLGALVAAVVPALPGPTRDEWGGAIVAVVALLVRELAWFLRNRRRS